MTSQTTPIQRTFDFDTVTLRRCVNNLRPKSLQTLFRGLLFAAVDNPAIIEDTPSADGRIVIDASVSLVSEFANVKNRTIERHKILHADLVTHVAGVNTAGQWEFNLRSVLPESAIGWFIDLVSESKNLNERTPDKMQNVAPTKSKCRPDKMQNVGANVAPTKPIFSSMCLVLNTAKLAQLSGLCEKRGIAIRDSDGTWAGLRMDLEGLRCPDIVDQLCELAIASGTYPDTLTTRNRFFVVAAIGTRTSWNNFRAIITRGWLTTTNESAVDNENGRKLKLRADEIRRRQAELQDAAVRAAQPIAAADMVTAADVPAEPTFVPVTPEARKFNLAKTAFGQKLLKNQELIESARIRRQMPPE